MIAVWLAFAPTQVGGTASYIIVIGKSMEPSFHIGDLVIVHREPIYQVGDAIVYRNLELKNFVFHRIISQQMGYYTLQGDNNSWVDTYKPSYEEVIGKLWLHIPKGGLIMQKIRSPIAMAVIAGVVGAVLATSLFKNKAKGNKPMKNQSFREWLASIKKKTQNWLTTTNSSEPKTYSTFSQGEILEGLFFILGLITISSLILGIIAFSRPLSRIIQDDISYEHLGIFSYSASTPQGVYDANTIKSGDPIFTKLTCFVDVNFQYTLVAAQAQAIAGTYQLTATISEPLSGWQRIVPLQEPTPFTGTAFGTTAKLDLCKIESLTQSLEQETDVHPGSYTLTITPLVKFNGEISDRAFESTFNSALSFRYDRVQFYLTRGEEQDNPLALTETGVLQEQSQQPNTMFLLGKELVIPTLRWITLISFMASLTGLTFLGLRLQSLSRLDQAKFFHIKYQSMMVDIQEADSILSSSVIEVTSMEALAKLAERFNVMILHRSQGNLHTYYVQAGGLTYRFTMTTTKTETMILDALPEVTGQEGAI
jgi:signal peptidase I